MKTLKISIALTFVALITSLIIFSIIKKNEPEKVKEPNNNILSDIIDSIDELKNKTDLKSSKQLYDEIAYQINESYVKNHPGSSTSNNDQQKNNLERDLFTTYLDQFIKLAKADFRKSYWDPTLINFIQKEKNLLINSPLLEPGSPVEMELRSIQAALNKYYEINSFIGKCKSLNCTDTDLASRFPIDTVKMNIDQANLYLDNNLENVYVSNCTDLRTELESIPQLLFNKHVLYLDNKINYWSDNYPRYGSHRDYSNLLYNPLKEEIQELDNTLYNVDNYRSQYYILLQKWRDDNSKAYLHDYE